MSGSKIHDNKPKGDILDYIEKFKFSKRLQQLNKKLIDKKIVIYGAGKFFETISKNYDVSELNIIGISDKKFSCHTENEQFDGYKVYSPSEILALNPDYVVVATQYYMDIIEDLHYNTLKDSKIKIIPLLKKDFWTLFQEAFSSK